MKKGFTLAETLITIGIIGVVAALTVPNIIENKRNRDLQVQLKKVYAEWNQISRKFLDDNEESISSYANTNGISGLINILPQYLKGVTVISNWTYGNMTRDDENKITNLPYEIYELDGSKVSGMQCDGWGFRTDIGGRYYIFDDAPKTGKNGPSMCIDLNGSAKPNVKGIDFFVFFFTTDGLVLPMGEEHSDNNYENSVNAGGQLKAGKNSCYKSTATTCAYYAIHDKSPFGDGGYWKDYIGRKRYK
ncbi:type II secretion system protein [bacterium]|nr:type II secretion system protein [bacterium]